MASFNAAGNVTINFTVVTAPAGKPVHVAAVVRPANGSGTWTDSVGNSGTVAFFGAVAGLPVRPLPASGLGVAVITTTKMGPGAVGASDINTAEVQARVAGSCPAGQALSAINANGTVVCSVTQPQVQFRAEGSTSQAIPDGVRTDLRWNAEVFNDGGGSDNSGTGVYTVPTTGSTK